MESPAISAALNPHPYQRLSTGTNGLALRQHDHLWLARVYHPWGWRDWQDFGNGCLGDFGCHILDPVFTALQIHKAPTHLVCTDHTGINEEVWPAQNVVKYDFPGTKFTEKDSFEIIWLDGGRRGNARGTHIPREIGLPSSGSLFHGTEGTMVLPHVGAPRLYPQEKFVGKIKEEASLDHYHGFIDGCLSGKQPSDGFDYAGPLTGSRPTRKYRSTPPRPKAGVE